MRGLIKSKAKVLCVVIAFGGSFAIKDIMSFEKEMLAYTNSFTSVLIFILSAVVLNYILKKVDLEDKRGVFLSLLFSALLAMALVVGKQLSTVGNCDFLNPWLWVSILLLTVYFGGFVLYCFQKIGTQYKNLRSGIENIRYYSFCPKVFFFSWIIVFLCWIPVFLALYPGAFVYDAFSEYWQVANRTFSTHHPLLHVLLLGGTVCFGNKYLGSYNAGIAVYTLFQMLVLSGIFAYMVERISNWYSFGEKKWKYFLLLAFGGVFPLFPMYAVCSTKDGFFHGFLILTLFFLLDFMRGSEERQKKLKFLIAFSFSSVFVLLFRKNAVYAYAIGLVVLMLLYFTADKKKWIGQLVVAILMALCLYSSIDFYLTSVLKADDMENQELLTVPIQQLGRVYFYTPEVFTDKERELLLEYLPEDILKNYDADLSDKIKYAFNNLKYNANPKEFLTLWGKIGIKKPLTYLNAWLMTSYGYWYPDTFINVYEGNQCFTFQYQDSSYFGFETEAPGIRDSKFPWLEEQYRKMSLEIYQQKVPVISMLFSPAFLFWIFLGTIFVLLYRKEYRLLLPFGLVLFIYCTFLLGPTFLVRYVLIFWLLLPLEILLLQGRTNDFS